MPLIVGGVVAGLGGVGKLFSGLSQNSNADRMRKNLRRPTYSIQQEYYNNQGLAENLAQQGLTADAQSFYANQADRGLTSGVNAILQGGGDVNNINGLYDRYNQGNMAVAARDSELQTDNIKYLIDRNKDLAGEKTKQWALNEYEPYKDQAQAISAQKAAAQQNIWGGVSEIGSAASALYQPKFGDSPYQTMGQKTGSEVLSTGTAPVNIPSAPTTFGGPDPFGSNPTVTPPIRQGATAALTGYQNSPYFEDLSRYIYGLNFA